MNSKFLFSLMTCALFGASGISHAAGNAQPLPLATAQSQGVSADGIKRIDTFFADEIANNRMPGAVLAVAKNGKLVIYKSYGYLNKATNTPMPLDANVSCPGFALARSTSSFTEFAASALVAQRMSGAVPSSDTCSKLLIGS